MFRSLALRSTAAGVVVLTASLTLAGTVSATSTPGLTANSISVGAIVTQSGGAAPSFAPYLSGVRAYFKMTNDAGGVNGRTINLVEALDDAANPSTNITDAHTLVATDKVFAIVGISSPFFTAASYLASPKGTGTPTFGYNAGTGWATAKNFFGAYGGVLNYTASSPNFAYVAKQLNAKSVAVFALNYGPSQSECNGGVAGLKKYGFKVNYSNISVPLFGGENWTTDAIQMKAKNVDFVVSCMDSTTNLAMSRAMHLQGMTSTAQLWQDGYNRDILRANAADMKNVYFMIQHVPFEAANPPAGLTAYFNAMEKYGYSANEYTDLALQGWMSAALFTQGLRAVGANPTQAGLVAAINKIKSDTGGGVAAPTDWTVAHTKNTSPGCDVYTVTAGTDTSSPHFTTAFGKWICFPISSSVNIDKPLTPPAGTPTF